MILDAHSRRWPTSSDCFSFPGSTGPRWPWHSRRRDSAGNTMSSSNRSEPLDLDEGLPVTRQDVEALFRARMQDIPSFALYIAFLEGLPPMDPADLRSRP